MSASARAVSPEVTLTYHATIETCTGLCAPILGVGAVFPVEIRHNRPGPGIHVLGTDIGIPGVPQGNDPDSDVQNTACLRDFGVGDADFGILGSFGLQVNGDPEVPGATRLELDADGNVLGGFIELETLDGISAINPGVPLIVTRIDVDAGTFASRHFTGGEFVEIMSGTGSFEPQAVPEVALSPAVGAILAIVFYGLRRFGPNRGLRRIA